MIRSILILNFIVLLLSACHKRSGQASEKPLVKVGNRALTHAVVSKLVHDNISKEDSAAVVDAYIDNWIRDQLMVIEAEKNIAENLDLNKLLEEYKASLLLYHYENKIIAEKLDTVVTDLQIQDYYDVNAGQYILSHRIIRPALFVSNKVLSNENLQRLKRFSQEDFIEFCEQYKIKALCKEDEWLGEQDFIVLTKGIFPEFNTLNKNTTYNEVENGKHFVMRIEEIKEPNAIPPVSYIKDKLIQEILHKRKADLLLLIRDDIFNKNINSGVVKIYE